MRSPVTHRRHPSVRFFVFPRARWEVLGCLLKSAPRLMAALPCHRGKTPSPRSRHQPVCLPSAKRELGFPTQSLVRRAVDESTIPDFTLCIHHRFCASGQRVMPRVALGSGNRASRPEIPTPNGHLNNRFRLGPLSRLIHPHASSHKVKFCPRAVPLWSRVPVFRSTFFKNVGRWGSSLFKPLASEGPQDQLPTVLTTYPPY